jgi:hypothetical protein
MNPLNIIAAAVSTILVFMVGAYTNNQSLGQAAVKPSVIRLLAIDTGSHSDGNDPNDHRVFSLRLLSFKGLIIGNGYQACIVVKSGVDQCSGVYNLPTGKITYSGSRQSREKYTFVVTGGTGSYLAAGGRLNSVLFGSNPFREKVVIHIE